MKNKDIHYESGSSPGVVLTRPGDWTDFKTPTMY